MIVLPTLYCNWMSRSKKPSNDKIFYFINAVKNNNKHCSCLKNSYLKTPEANNTDLIRRELALAKVASSRAAVGDRQASHPCFFQTAFPTSLNFIC